MKRFLIFLCILALVSLPSCNPTEESTAAATVATRTSLPTVTSTATATPYPPLAARGPYLIFGADPGGFGRSLMVVDSSGSGRQVLDLPADARFDLHQWISPDGKWLAFYTGTSWEEPYDLTLNLLSLPDGAVRTVTRVIAPGFPDTLMPVAEAELQENTDPDCQNVDCWLSTIKWIFLETIDDPAWSPDGRYLAFPAQIDGPSSDLYLYEPGTGILQRLSDEPANISRINWPPDGQWVVYEEMIHDLVYGSVGGILRAIRPNGESVSNHPSLVEGYWWFGVGWLAPDRYLFGTGMDGYGPANLRSVDVETGAVTELWPDLYFTFAVDPENDLIALSSYHNANGYPEAGLGLFFISFDGNWRNVSEIEFDQVIYLGYEDTRFLATNADGTFAISADGTVTLLSEGRLESISPDRQWYVISSASGIDLYSADQMLVAHVDDHYFPLTWRSDSAGVLMTLDGSLVYLSVQNGQMLTMETCLAESCPYCGFDFDQCVWIP